MNAKLQLEQIRLAKKKSRSSKEKDFKRDVLVSWVFFTALLMFALPWLNDLVPVFFGRFF